MTSRKTLPATTIVLSLALLLLAGCGAPEPSPAVVEATATPAPATATPTQVPAPSEEPVSEPSPSTPGLSKPARHVLFLQTWMFVNNRYVYPDYGGVDWEAVKEEYSVKVGNAASDKDFYDLMREMIDLLGDEHSSFLAPETIALQDAAYDNLQIPGGIGASVRVIDGEPVLVQVFPGHPAFEAGLQPGERIVAVDGVSWDQFAVFDELILAIIGEAGTEVVLTVRSRDGTERQVPVTRALVDLENVLVQGSVIEDTRFGLLTLNGFDSPQVTELVRETLGDLTSSGPLEGLIVDVRTNSGGGTEALLETLALFVAGGSIGSQEGRKEAYDLLIPEGGSLPELEGLPVVVLTGPNTVGESECFAAALQLRDRATIVGLPSAGNTEYYAWHELSDGSVLRLAEWVYELPDGSRIEGRGIQPDVLVQMDWWLYRAQDDPQIQKAIEVLGAE